MGQKFGLVALSWWRHLRNMTLPSCARDWLSHGRHMVRTDDIQYTRDPDPAITLRICAALRMLGQLLLIDSWTLAANLFQHPTFSLF